MQQPTTSPCPLPPMSMLTTDELAARREKIVPPRDSKRTRPNIEIGGKGFSGFAVVLQFIYRLRSPRLYRLWPPPAHMCPSVGAFDMCARTPILTKLTCALFTTRPSALMLEINTGTALAWTPRHLKRRSPALMRPANAFAPRPVQRYQRFVRTLLAVDWRSIGDLVAI